MVSVDFSRREVEDQLNLILSTPPFQRSSSLSQFLRFIVDLTLDGRADEIKEYRIGSEVFGRGEDFDPRTDTIVRTQAHRLRTLLQNYYSTNPAAPILIDFPKGTYVPLFRSQTNAPTPPAPVSVPPRPNPWRIAVPAGLALAALGLWFYFDRRPPAPSLPVALLTLDLTPQGSLDFDRGVVILAPSGRAAIIPVIETSGVRRLWIRSLNSGMARPLNGTEEAYLPFWSPDETEIGFFMSGRLKIHRLADASIRDLCDAPLGRGGAWSNDGTILFAPQSSGRIFRIPAAGGKPVPLTQLNSALKENDHRWPEFLPGGRQFLYTARARNRTHDSVYLASLDAPASPVRLLTFSSQARFARTDQGDALLYVRDGALRARRFASGGRTLERKEIELVDGVRYSAVAGAAFSLGNGLLAYHTYNAEKSELAVYDRSGRLSRRLTPPGLYSGVTASRDGARLALEIVGHPRERGEIWIADTKDPSPVRFTFHGGSFPAWSADSRSLHYLGAGEGLSTLFMKPLTSAETGTLVWKHDHPIFLTDRSLSGRFAAFHVDRPDSLMDLYLLPLDAETGAAVGDPVLFRRTQYNETHGFFSPDEHHLAYVSDESGRWEVYVAELLPSGQAGRVWRVSEGGGNHPSWRSDGRELYYLSPTKTLMSVRLNTRPWAVEKPVKLFDSLAFSGGDSKSPYAAAPDGQSFVINTIRVDPSASPVRVLTSWASLLGTH